MILTVPSHDFVVGVVKHTLQIADTPQLRFEFTSLEVDGKGNLKPIELPEPMYSPAGELSDDVPIVKRRFPQPLPIYPTDLKKTTGAWIVSTSGLALDVWLEVSRAYMSHFCKPTKPDDKKGLVKPLYRLRAGIALRYTRKADEEVWVRELRKPWKFDKIVEGTEETRFDGVHWGNDVTAAELIEGTKCMELPKDQPRDMWKSIQHGVARSFVLPYSPPLPPPDDGK